MEGGSAPKRARTSTDAVGKSTGVIDCARSLGAELAMGDPKPLTIRKFVAALKGSTGQRLPQHARDEPYKLMLHLARGQEEQALTSLSLMCQLAQDLRAEEGILTQVLKHAFFYKTPHGMDDELSRRLHEAIKEANAAAEDKAEWESLRNLPSPAPPRVAVATGSAAAFSIDAQAPQPHAPDGRPRVAQPPWDRGAVLDSARIGWPGVPLPGFVDACVQQVAYLKQLGHDVVESIAPDEDVEAYEAGICTLELDAHRAVLNVWQSTTSGIWPSASYLSKVAALTAPQRRDLCVPPVTLPTPERV